VEPKEHKHKQHANTNNTIMELLFVSHNTQAKPKDSTTFTIKISPSGNFKIIDRVSMYRRFARKFGTIDFFY